MSDAPRLPWHSLPLSEVSIYTGALRALAAAGYTTLGEVSALTPAELRGVKGLDVRSYRRLRRHLHELSCAHAKQLRLQGMSLRQAAAVLGVSSPETVRTWANEGKAPTNKEAQK